MSFERGAIATFEAAWIYPNAFPTLTDSFVEVIGTDGHLHFDRKRESIEMSTAAVHVSEDVSRLRRSSVACAAHSWSVSPTS